MMLRQYELNVAIFKAAVASFDRLQLEVSDGTTGEDTAHAVSRLFIRYATFLLKTWEVTRYDGNVSTCVAYMNLHVLTLNSGPR